MLKGRDGLDKVTLQPTRREDGGGSSALKLSEIAGGRPRRGRGGVGGVNGPKATRNSGRKTREMDFMKLLCSRELLMPG